MILTFEHSEVVIRGQGPKVLEVGRALAAKFRAVGTASTVGHDEYRFTLSPVSTRTRVRQTFEVRTNER